jgi:hypothetical protein
MADEFLYSKIINGYTPFLLTHTPDCKEARLLPSSEVLRICIRRRKRLKNSFDAETNFYKTIHVMRERSMYMGSDHICYI